MYKCSTCSKGFATPAGLKSHAKAKKHDHFATKCSGCDKSFPTKQAYEDHAMTKGHGVYGKSLPKTSHQSTPAVLLKETSPSLQSGSTAAPLFRPKPTHYCWTCGGYHPESSAQFHSSSSARQLSCPVCNRAFESKQDHDQHLKEAHQYVECSSCSELFTSLAVLVQHLKSSASCRSVSYESRPDRTLQTEALPQPFLCDVVSCSLCDLQTSSDQLQSHFKTSVLHPKCIVCFEDQKAYNEHSEVAHPNMRCHNCKILFKSEDHLIQHYFESESPIHSRCVDCQIGFEDEGAYTEHMNLVHPSPSAGSSEEKERLPRARSASVISMERRSHASTFVSSVEESSISGSNFSEPRSPPFVPREVINAFSSAVSAVSGPIDTSMLIVDHVCSRGSEREREDVYARRVPSSLERHPSLVPSTRSPSPPIRSPNRFSSEVNPREYVEEDPVYIAKIAEQIRSGTTMTYEHQADRHCPSPGSLGRLTFSSSAGSDWGSNVSIDSSTDAPDLGSSEQHRPPREALQPPAAPQVLVVVPPDLDRTPRFPTVYISETPTVSDASPATVPCGLPPANIISSPPRLIQPPPVVISSPSVFNPSPQVVMPSPPAVNPSPPPIIICPPPARNISWHCRICNVSTCVDPTAMICC